MASTLGSRNSATTNPLGMAGARTERSALLEVGDEVDVSSRAYAEVSVSRRGRSLAGLALVALLTVVALLMLAVSPASRPLLRYMKLDETFQPDAGTGDDWLALKVGTDLSGLSGASEGVSTGVDEDEEDSSPNSGTDDWLGVIMADGDDGDSSTSVSSRLFTLNRVGYDPLDYFAQSPSSSMTYAMLADYVAVIEPNAPMDLVIFDSSSDSGYDEVNSYIYQVCPKGSTSTDDCQYGSIGKNKVSTSFSCSPLTDAYEIEVLKMDAFGEEMSDFELKGNALCVYVRREMRDLSDEDLSKTMDAMYTMWTLAQEDGISQYGQWFKNSTYFASAHDFNAAWQDADHIHEGLGFLPQHMKITNLFELAMQSVDNSVTLPYWDFTIDYAQNLTIFESPIFTEETFGTLKSPADHYWGWTYKNDKIEDALIQDGRWKATQADLNYQYPELQNGFGYIRGPWNMNPSPYITRFTSYTLSLPSCLDYYAWASDKEFVDFLEIAAYGPHASTHGVIGSVYGCDLMDPLLEDGIIRDEDSQLSICKKWGFYLKELYRSNYIVPRTDCSYTSLAKNDIDCGFTCNTNTYEAMLTELPSVISSQYVPEQMDTEDWVKWRDFICTGDASLIFVGDHLESASPSDPSFWVIHPTQERLLQAKYIGGGWDSTYWPSDSKNEYVCDKSECYESDYGSKDYYSECCYGHYENDQLLDFENGDKTKGIGPTNGQIMADTNPNSLTYAMPYIYQHFMWNHCDEDFESMLTGKGLSGSSQYGGPAQASSSVDTTTRSSSKSKRSSSKSSSKKTKSKSSKKGSKMTDKGTKSKTKNNKSKSA